jgi:hypothetical protein
MFNVQAIQPTTTGRRAALLIGKIAAVLAVPLYSFGTTLPLVNSGAPQRLGSIPGTALDRDGRTQFPTPLRPPSYLPGRTKSLRRLLAVHEIR